MCRSFFYAVLTYCALPITVTARSWSKNEHFSLYREKAREEKEGKHRLWERCVNRLRFSAVSIAAAREKREGGFFAQAACRRSFALPFLPEYQGLFCIIVRRNRAKVLLYPFIKVKAHGFCIGNPEPAHPVTLAGNPVLAGDSAKRVKQILVGNRNNTFLFASWLGELEALRLVALAGTDRKYSCFRIQQTQNKGGITQVLKHFLGESHAILIQEHVRVATFAIMNSFLLLRYLYFSHGTAIPEVSVSAVGSVLSAVYLPLLITLILTTGFLEHKLSANVTNLMDGLRAVAGGDYSVRLKTDKHQLLDDLCEDFNRMAEELQSVRTLREDFVNSYSHEFKTPITAIKGFAELLSEPDLTEEERQQYLRIIQDESVRLAELTNRTLLLTKLQSQRFLPDQTTFSLDEQIRRCAILCAHSWEEKRLTFSAELESVDCTSNEELLRQVWINLLNNAIRYTPPGGEIGVELRQVGGEAVVRVWDTGSGMTPEVQSHIFEKYYQGAAEDKKQGLGLGLSIVHRIIELTEGRIEVASQPQQGSSFTVYLPLNQKGA